MNRQDIHCYGAPVLRLLGRAVFQARVERPDFFGESRAHHTELSGNYLPIAHRRTHFE